MLVSPGRLRSPWCRSLQHALLGGLVLVATGCTFYTSCPTDDGRGNNDSGPLSGEPPEGEWEPVVPAEVADIEMSCGPADYMAGSPIADLLVANINESGLWASDDGGDSWRQLGLGEGSASVPIVTRSIVFDPENQDRFWQIGGDAETPGLLHTVDGGETFEQLSDVTELEALSVDFADGKRRTLLATGRAEEQRVLLSKDGGASFDDISERLPTGLKRCRYPLVLDGDVMLLGCGSQGSGKPRILRSTNGGKNWSVVHEDGVGAEPLLATDGSVYWPRESRKGLLRSIDRGKTWQQAVGADVLVPMKPLQLFDGSIAALSGSEVIASGNRGQSWSRVSPPIPFEPQGLAYLNVRQQLFTYHVACDMALPDAQAEGMLRFSQ